MEPTDKTCAGVDSQTTVPATSPELKESMKKAKELHNEALRNMEAEASAEKGTEATPQTRRVSSEPLLTHKKHGKTIKGPGVKKAAAKARSKGKRTSAVKSAPKPKMPKDVNPFDLPPDANQTTLPFPKTAAPPPHVKQPEAPVSAPLTRQPEAPVPRLPDPQEKKDTPNRANTMDDMKAMLNRGDTHDLGTPVTEPSPAEEPSLNAMGELLDSEIERKGRKPKTQQEKERHARRMRFFRSLTSPFLSWGACFSGT